MKVLKNLLSIVPYPLFPTTSAGRKTILHFNNYLSKKINAHAVNVTYSEIPDVKFDLIPVFSNSKLRYINLLQIFKIRKLLKQTHADFLLIEHPYMAWMGLALQMFTSVKWGIRSHNIEYERFRDFNKWWWPLLRQYELFVYKKADAVFFITESDKKTAKANTRLKQGFVMPTGMLVNRLPTDAADCKAYLQQQHGIAPGEKILLYNGALGYGPNRNALDVLLQTINPALEQTPGFKYKLVVCGGGLDDSYNNLQGYAKHNVIYCGFVDDISVYFKGADLYLNPVIGGGGIKTRLVESISYNTNVVSTENGSIGFNTDTAAGKLVIIKDHDWKAFTAAILSMCQIEKTDTTDAFYEYYYWDNIIERFIRDVNSVLA